MADHCFDAIVLGMGGVGSAAIYELATRGVRVLGIDQFEPGHDHGSSHGETRAIRKAYFEHPDYVPLLQRAYEKWRALETRSGKSLLHEVGLLEIGPPDGQLISGVRESARKYNLRLEEYTAPEVVRRFPGFVIPERHVSLFEPEGGYLLVEQCIKAAVEQAVQLGATLKIGRQVTAWHASASEVRVTCGLESFTAKRLVVTAGPWASQLLSWNGLSLQVLRKHLHWVAIEPSAYPSATSPVFFYDTPQGFYYGFPSLDGRTIKVAEHSHGEPVTDPSTLERAVDPVELSRVERFINGHLPSVVCSGGKPLCARNATCMYTMSPDENFFVGLHPVNSNVCFAAGLSGHGFKFASVLGEILADLALDQQTNHGISFLSPSRFGNGQASGN
jgi:sarcosine oxidase